MNDACLSRIAVEPTDDLAWYVGGMNGLYMSKNGGQSWTKGQRHELGARPHVRLCGHVSARSRTSALRRARMDDACDAKWDLGVEPGGRSVDLQRIRPRPGRAYRLDSRPRPARRDALRRNGDLQ